MRTTIVEGVHASLLVDEQNRTGATLHDHAPLVPKLGQGADAFHVIDGLVHGWECGTARGSPSREETERTGTIM